MLKPSFTRRSYADSAAPRIAHPDLPQEQAYADRAYERLDRIRETVERAGEAGASEVAALALEAWSARRLQTFAGAERASASGWYPTPDTS